jgi:hypothetical protein
MKKLTILFLLLFLSKINAQNFSGTLFMRDKSSFYLNQIYVTNLNEQRTYLTNFNGEFSIPAKVGDVIRFTSIISERKDITITKQLLEYTNNLIELEVAYKEIQEVVLSRFKPTGNLRKDVRSLDSKKSSLEIAKIVNLPAPKGDGTPPVIPVASLANGGFNLSLESLYDVISGQSKKKQRLQEYEKMAVAIKNIKAYLGDDYFVRLKVPSNLVDNFLQFVYSSDNIGIYLQVSNYEAVKVSIEKYLPIYQKRLRASNLQNILITN